MEPRISRQQLATLLPQWLIDRLANLREEYGQSVYLAGGTVRDLLLGSPPADIDLTVSDGARQWARSLATATGGTYIPLGRKEDAARVVYREVVVDFSAFRQEAARFDQELRKRDITINSMGICLDAFLGGGSRQGDVFFDIVDPTGGLQDLVRGVIRASSQDALSSDPLRLLRVYRFAAVLGFSVEPVTLRWIHALAGLITTISPERVSHELDLILATRQAAASFRAMADSNLLWSVFPELREGMKGRQRANHHLDVVNHNLETLHQAEQLLDSPDSGYAGQSAHMTAYFAERKNSDVCKWAALLHDGRNLHTRVVDSVGGQGRNTYKEDHTRAAVVRAIGQRLRWSNQRIEGVTMLVVHYMYPFHLLSMAGGQVSFSTRACIRLITTLGEALPGVFVLAMAGALAGHADPRSGEVASELARLFDRVERVRLENVLPVLCAAPLITGHDLIQELGLQPGPQFKRILEAVRERQMEQVITTRDEALRWARTLAAREREEEKPCVR